MHAHNGRSHREGYHKEYKIMVFNISVPDVSTQLWRTVLHLAELMDS